MKKPFLFSLLFLIQLLSFSNSVINPQPPQWIKVITVNEPDTIVEEAYQYLLLDYQNHLANDEFYLHYAIKILNAQGIQDFSNLEFQFDPHYESIEIHTLNILRNGHRINKLKSSKIEIVQRETDYERAIYDGKKSVLIILDDIREGDILEYSYTLKGSNPINGKYRGGSFYQEYSVFVNRIYNRIISKSNQSIKYKLFNGAAEPATKKGDYFTEYEWDIPNAPIKLKDQNAPSWYDPFKSVEYTTFNSWGEVVDWALPIYEYNTKHVDEIVKDLTEKEGIVYDVMSAVRFVQNHIRYLGIESGINNYKPHDPLQVYQQRYGDCKDKSLLLVAILQRMGYEAYPMLVNTFRLKNLSNALASNQAFNHLVVYLKYNHKDYFFDATASDQGGDLEHNYFYPFGYGLLVKEGEQDLMKIPKPQRPEISIEETFTMDSIGGGGFLHIKTLYTGSKADEIRDGFASQNIKSINQQYLDFYSNIYSNISSQQPILIRDDFKDSKNIFEVNEYYRIDDLWMATQDSSQLFIETYAMVLNDYLQFDRTANRKMPMYIGEPFKYEQKSILKMPYDWNVTLTKEEIEHEVFNYKSKMHSNGSTVFFIHQYEQFSSYIEPEQMDDFFNKLDLVYDEFSLSVIHYISSDEFQLSWLSVIIILFSGILAFFIFRKIYHYDPEPKKYYGAPTSIGGWMVLPLIGMFITPFLIGFQIYNAEYLDQNLWQSALNNGENSVNLLFLILAELLVNLQLIGFAILLLILFLKKRSSLPLLIIVFYISNFIILAADSLILYKMGFDINSEDVMEIVKSILRISIWLPFFLVSERVKSTFVIQLHESSNREEPSSS